MNTEFLLTSIIVILLPGTGVIYTVSIGLGRGLIPSFAAAFGCTLRIIPAAIASIIGLAAVLHTSALAFLFLKYLGVAYLMYMAWSIFRDGSDLDVSEEKLKTSLTKIAINGMLLNVLNPKLSLFFLAFLPQFVPVGIEGSTFALVSLALLFMILTFIVFIIYGALAAYARDYVISKPVVLDWFKKLFAGTFAFLGLKLAFSER